MEVPRNVAREVRVVKLTDLFRARCRPGGRWKHFRLLFDPYSNTIWAHDDQHAGSCPTEGTRASSGIARRRSGAPQDDRLSHTDGTGRPWLKAGQDNHGGGASGVDQAESIRSTKLQPRSRSTAPDTMAKVRTTPRITGPSTRW